MIIDSGMVISGFVSKVINEVVDVPLNPIKNKIKNADNNRRDKNQSIETRIYQVTIDSINKFTNDTYRGQDNLYDAAESILRGFKNSNNNTEAVRVGLKMLVTQVTVDICEDFLRILCHEICIDKNDILYKEIILLQHEQMHEDMYEGFDVVNRNDEKTHEKLDYALEGINKIDKKIDSMDNHTKRHYEKPIKNRIDEYADKWNENVFLNNFNEEDENAGTEIKLSEIYKEKCLPHYIWKTNTNTSNKLSNLLSKYIIDKNGKNMLLILGQPGIGKSTLITWMISNLIEKKEDVYVYQFAFDLKNVNWESDNILHEIFEVLNLRYDELENKTLILDGFDEIYINNNRERILNKMNQELKRMNFLQKFSLFITCRENYVDRTQLEENDYIILQEWDEDQIKCFCEVYEKESARKNTEKKFDGISEIKINKIIERKEIFGIPLILYMVLALNVDIEKGSSTVDIYDQIFSLKKGGIYDRCYDVEHRINSPEIKKHIHRISQRIAFWIFENEDSKTCISQETFEEICNNEISEFGGKVEEIQTDTLIGNFFKLNHCEGKGTKELQFVHRSIYEYFVVIYFFESIHKLKSKEEVAGKLGELLKDGHLSKQILEFIKCKFDSMERKYLLDNTKDVFGMMLRDGMTYYFIKEQKKPLFDIIVREMNIFSNMLELIHLWDYKLGYYDRKIVVYLQHNHFNGLNLDGADLNGEDLSGAYLSVAYLRNADLSGADLGGAYLSGADLNGADLRNADLGVAYLSDADLNGADLRDAYLFGADLRDADLKDADLRDAYLSDADLSGADLRDADLRNADLNGADLNRADLNGADLNGTDLRRADLSKADLSGAYLSEADLSGADLRQADLSGADLRQADLSGAYLSGADLSKADLSGADLSGADLSGADLSGADLSGADLNESIFNEKQVGILYEIYDLRLSRVFMFDTDEIIRYKEYCIRKLKG